MKWDGIVSLFGWIGGIVCGIRVMDNEFDFSKCKCDIVDDYNCIGLGCGVKSVCIFDCILDYLELF